MCGIVGIIQTDNTPVSRVVLEAVMASLVHRGPHGREANKQEEIFGISHNTRISKSKCRSSFLQ